MTTTLQVQERLIALGYFLGPTGADGIPGRLTTKAIANFQADRRLDIKNPGSVGPKTLAALGLSETETVIPPWIEVAQRNMGLHEVRDNKALKEFLKSYGHALGDPAKVPWCGDCVETCKRVIAEILGWEEDHVDKIIRRYVGRTAATEAVIRKLDEARARTEAVKPPVKPSEKGSA